jgi:hypothetical protein
MQLHITHALPLRPRQRMLLQGGAGVGHDQVQFGEVHWQLSGPAKLTDICVETGAAAIAR